MSSKNQAHARKLCGAKTRAGTPCKNYAMANGRCRMHGGKSTGPKNQKDNKNAVTTGEYESIIFDVLEDDEKELYYKVSLDRLVQVNEDIRLTDIRLRRMLLRIKELQQQEYFILNQKKGTERGEETNVSEAENPLIQIQNIEDSITRVQRHKSRLIDLKHKLEQDLGIDNELKRARIDKIKADTNKITGAGQDVEDLGDIFKEIYGDVDDN